VRIFRRLNKDYDNEEKESRNEGEPFLEKYEQVGNDECLCY